MTGVARLGAGIAGELKAGIDVGYFPGLPSSETVYGKPIP